MELPNLNLPNYSFELKRKGGKLYIKCLVRNKILLLTPEEWVRQNFIAYLIEEKKVPKNLVAVEKQLKLNGRIKRFDILIYSKTGNPIVLIECKAHVIEIKQTVFEQISSYNMTLKVPYLIVTNGMNHFISKIDFDNQSFEFLNEIPLYTQYT